MTLQKTDSFQPLTTVTPADTHREFRVTVIPNVTSTPPFKNLSQTANPAAEQTSPKTNPNCEPRLSLERDGERISSIRIQCSCGQVMELACIYDDLANAK